MLQNYEGNSKLLYTSIMYLLLIQEEDTKHRLNNIADYLIGLLCLAHTHTAPPILTPCYTPCPITPRNATECNLRPCFPLIAQAQRKVTTALPQVTFAKMSPRFLAHWDEFGPLSVRNKRTTMAFRCIMMFACVCVCVCVCVVVDLCRPIPNPSRRDAHTQCREATIRNASDTMARNNDGVMLLPIKTANTRIVSII